MNQLFDLDIEPEETAPMSAGPVALEMEPAPAPARASDDIEEAMPTVVRDVVAPPLVEVLGPDVQLPVLIRFIPNLSLRTDAERAAAYALAIKVDGSEGLQAADVALTDLRGRQNAISAHFAEPAEIANRLHKRITGLRGEWLTPGDDAIRVVGQRVWTEKQRLDRLAAEQRRKEQAEADQQAKADAKRRADEAAKQHAPTTVVEELQRRAETATAPPVAPVNAAPVLQGVSTVTAWKARIKGTPADADPNPKMADLTPAQQAQVIETMKAVIAGTTAMTCFELNWSAINGRAKADKGTLAIPGFEPYQEGSIRSKGVRRARG